MRMFFLIQSDGEMFWEVLYTILLGSTQSKILAVDRIFAPIRGGMKLSGLYEGIEIV